MNTKSRNKKCLGCDISHRKRANERVAKILAYGDILRLGDNWILHHSTGDEGFLGWLVLQPYKHRRNLCDFSREEAREFGEVVGMIEKSLDAYWRKEFPEDPLERVYVACFYESSSHLHLHIVPRPKSFEDLHVCTKSCSVFEDIDVTAAWPYGWRIYLAHGCHQFPDRYRRDKQKTMELMAFLKTKLPSERC